MGTLHAPTITDIHICSGARRVVAITAKVITGGILLHSNDNIIKHMSVGVLLYVVHKGCYWNYVNIPAQIILAMLWMGQFGHKARQLMSPHAVLVLCAASNNTGTAANCISVWECL